MRRCLEPPPKKREKKLKKDDFFDHTLSSLEETEKKFILFRSFFLPFTPFVLFRDSLSFCFYSFAILFNT